MRRRRGSLTNDSRWAAVGKRAALMIIKGAFALDVVDDPTKCARAKGSRTRLCDVPNGAPGSPRAAGQEQVRL